MIDSIRQALNRLRAFFRKEPLDRDVEAEMAAHLELAIEENLRRGLPAPEARRQAFIKFGGVEQAKERHREARSLPALEMLVQDLRYTFRNLRRERVFTFMAVLILALGIGANVAVFSVVNTILLRPLPFRDPQRLAWFAGNNGVGGLGGTTYEADAFEQYQRANRSFQEMTAFVPFYSFTEGTLMGPREPVPVSGVWVAGNFFETLGVQPALGRLFTAEECVKGARPAVLLSYPFWQRQFAANPAIVGQAITLNHEAVTVVGVLPPSFDFGAVFAPGEKMDILSPIIMDRIRTAGHTLSVIGRLEPGVTVAQAQAEAKILFPHLPGASHPDWGSDIKTTIVGLKEHVSGMLRRSLIALWCAVGLILLIVCVNLSNLQLARGAARSKEFALRSALGAGRGRLICQLLTESLLLSGAGAALGLGLAFAITRFLAHQGSMALPLLGSVEVDGAALAWTLLIAICVGVLFGLAPALRAPGRNLQEALKDTGPSVSQGRQHERLRSTLVISEVALACVLLVAAGLLLRSFLRVLDVDLGFQPSRAAAVKVKYDDGGNADRRSAILQEMLRHVTAIPGIEAAGIADMLPLDRNRSWWLLAKGAVFSKDQEHGVFAYLVTPGYLEAMGMHLRAGRDFNWQDTPKNEPVIIINQAAARREWPGQDPIGRLALGIGDHESRVVGVISDVRESSLENASSPEVYVPVTQAVPAGAELVVRTKLPPEVLASSVMKTLRSLNAEQPATEFRPIQQIVDHAVSPRRFFVLLVSAFAVLGLVLASLGIYGVISYSVTRQTQEIGIRMALGATQARVLMGVISKTLRLALAGIVLGMAASFVVARLIASLLFGTAPTDPVTFAAMALLLCGVACLAGFIPARRAACIDPMRALRNI
jgi:predicted permease